MAEHDDSERIDVVADRQPQVAEDAEGIPIAGEMDGGRCYRLCVFGFWLFSRMLFSLHHGQMERRIAGRGACAAGWLGFIR